MIAIDLWSRLQLINSYWYLIRPAFLKTCLSEAHYCLSRKNDSFFKFIWADLLIFKLHLAMMMRWVMCGLLMKCVGTEAEVNKFL
jgi:hypothetical protein